MANIGGDLDWLAPNPSNYGGNYSHCGYHFLSVDKERLTIAGCVVDWFKRNNMMYALIGREMGITEIILYNIGDPSWGFANGSADTPRTKESYNVGFDLFNGNSLQSVMQTRGRSMQEPNGYAIKEWPSSEKVNVTFIRRAESKLNALIGK